MAEEASPASSCLSLESVDTVGIQERCLWIFQAIGYFFFFLLASEDFFFSTSGYGTKEGYRPLVAQSQDQD